MKFKKLNTIKFEIINEIAPMVDFNTNDASIETLSYEPFRREWDKVSKGNLLVESRFLPGIPSFPSTSLEIYVIMAFIWIFVIIGLLALVSTITNLCPALSEMEKVLHL